MLGKFRLVVAVAVAVALAAVNLAAVPVAGAALDAGGGVPSERRGPLERPDVVSAQILARAAGERVEVTGLRSETTTVWVNPDGTRSAEIAAGPVRALQPDGGWADIDTTLEVRDGAVRPKVAVADLAFSSGGSEAAAARLGAKARSVAFGWKAALPAPALAGSVATYRDVATGVDLELEALPGGFKERLVLRSRPVGPVTFRFPLRLAGLVAAQDGTGRIDLSDRSSGAVVASADPAAMWGAAVDPRSLEPVRQARVTTRLVVDASGPVLEVAPDPVFVADPTVQLPIVVDPAPNLTATSDTWVQNTYSSSQWSSTELRSGTFDGGSTKARSLVKFTTSTLTGTHILSADLKLWNWHSYSCSETQVNVYRLTQSFGSSTNWANQPSAGTTIRGSKVFAHGYSSSCPDAWGVIDITSLTQDWADGTYPNYGVQVKANDENNTLGWKKYNSADASSYRPTLVVSYNSYPSTPASSSLSPAAGAWVTTLTPTLKGKFSDPDGGTGAVKFEVAKNSDGTVVASGSSATITSGSTGSWAVPSGKLTSGTVYKWRARNHDGTDYSSWTSWRTFTPDNVAPTVPLIASTTHPLPALFYDVGSFAGSWTASDASSGVVGYSVVFDQTASTTPSATVTQTGTTYSNASVADGVWYLHVRAKDNAGNWGSTAHFQLNEGTPAVVSPAAGTRTARRLPLQAAGVATTATLQWRIPGGSWADIPAGDVRLESNGAGIGQWPVSLSGTTTPMMVWDVAATRGGDGPVEVRAVFNGGGTTAAVASELDSAALVSQAAAVPVGPGAVNLITGNYTVSATDVALDSFGGALTVSRAYNSRDPLAGLGGPLGPGWQLSLPVDGVAAWSSITEDTDRATVYDADGLPIVFSLAGGVYTPEVGAEGLALTKPNAATFALVDLDATTTTFARLGATSSYLPKTVQPAAAAGTTAIVADATTGWPLQMIAPPPPGVDCTATPAPRGCRILTFTYGSAGSGGPTRLTQVDLTVWDPATSQTATEAVARFGYDSADPSWRLNQTWDPRISPALTTTYGYDAAGHLTTLTPPGELGWTVTYAAVGADANTGRLASVRRPRLPAGNGDAVSTVVYGVSLSSPYAMTQPDVAAWGQADVAVDATAIFPPDQVPASPPTSWTRATVFYVDAEGRTTNVASPGGHITTTEYDGFGNVVRDLSAANRALVLAGLADPTKVDAQRTYSADGLDLLAELGPLHDVALADGTVVSARAHTTNTYDQGATGGPYHLVTTSVTGALVDGETTDREPRTTTFGYANGGWALRRPTTTVTDDVAGGLRLTSTTRYDGATGLETERRQPADTAGTTAGTTKTLYYSAGSSSDPACADRPEWANLVCKVFPAAQPGTPGLPDLPVTATTYTKLLQPATVTSTVGASSRTTTVTYDGAGRPVSQAVTSTDGAALAAVTFGYHAATGRPATVGDGSSTITRGYDALGRLESYQDADGNTSTFGYDMLDRVMTRFDGKGTQTITYDSAVDPRGLPTRLDDSAAGRFDATYDPDGRLVTHTFPNGVQARSTFDAAGQTTETTYTQTVSCTTGCVWFGFTAARSVHGQVIDQASELSAQHFGYDGAGRLTHVEDTPAGQPCTVRDYGFDADTNRTSLTSRPANPDGSCLLTGGSTQTSTFDTADRLTDNGIAYDPFGRITTVAMPAGATVTSAYYVNDLARSITSGGQTRTWTLDPARRHRSWTDTADGQTRTHHFAGDNDAAAWTTENTAGTVWTRSVAGLDGGLAAIDSSAAGVEIQLTNPHGDVIATAANTPGVAAPTATFDNDEYGNPRNTPRRYGWLGEHRRYTDTPSGITLMGVRLYSPQHGRFLQTDPVLGGNDNPYVYPADPVNRLDVSGESQRGKGRHRHKDYENLTVDELRERYRDPGTSASEKQKIKEELKARGSYGAKDRRGHRFSGWSRSLDLTWRWRWSTCGTFLVRGLGLWWARPARRSSGWGWHFDPPEWRLPETR